MRKLEDYKNTVAARDTYEQIAANYDRVRVKPMLECLNFIRSFEPNSVVLDLGCGNGRHTLASALADHETIGVDFSKSMIFSANRKLRSASSKKFHLVVADVSQLPFQEDSFNYVLYMATLHNLPTHSLRIRSLNEVGRVLMPKGKCLISVWKRLQSRFLSVIIKTYIAKTLRSNSDFETLVSWKRNGSTVFRYYYLYSARQLKKDIMDTNLRIICFFKNKMGVRMLSNNYFATVTIDK